MSKIIFWDWTGTLADESRLDEAVCLSLEKDIAAKRNIPVAEAKGLFNDRLKAVEHTWQWHDYVQHGKDFEVDWRHSQEIHLDKLLLVPHAREILAYAKSKGYLNVLVTNAVREVVSLRAEHVGLLHMFEEVIASSDMKALKAEGKHFAYGLQYLGGDPKKSFSVGDNPVQDIQPAKKLGVKTIFCDFGDKLVHYHSEHIANNHGEASHADYTIKSLQEIEKIIQK
ncbi:MAG: HAD family hydrolase [Candidatus Aminicenantes bacterium]|jgi:FMN phosphatase YigB (HAD superfamily)